MSNNLTKRDIVLKIFEKTKDIPQSKIQETVQMTLDIVLDALAEGRNVELRNFGVFEVQKRKARVGRNPNRPETDVVIPTRAVVKFKAGKVLKARIKDINLDTLQAAAAIEIEALLDTRGRRPRACQLATMSNFKSLPGFREFYPEDFAERRFLFQVWRQVARRFGFQEYDGPVLESLELFKAKSGDEIESQLFCFEDKGGREISLRPELTPTLARMVAARANALKRPVKWFSIGDNFRYERMQKGRLRCFTQLNADILGEAGPAAELELLALLIQTLQGFGLGEEDFFIRLSDRDLWMLYLEAQGFAEQSAKILEIVDKWERMPEETAKEKLGLIVGESAGEVWKSLQTFLGVRTIADLSQAFQSVSGSSDLGEALAARIRDWTELLDGLDAMGIGGYVEMDLSIVRGLAYYTGFVFEAFDRAKENRALAGGGRYNRLIQKMGGPDMPAVGFGMGDVVLADILRERGIMPRFVDTLDAYLVIGGEKERAAALCDVAVLRQSGFSVDYSFKNQAFGKQFKAASASGARFALIYGSEELEKGVVKIRNLADRSEEDVPRAQLPLSLRDRLGQIFRCVRIRAGPTTRSMP